MWIKKAEKEEEEEEEEEMPDNQPLPKEEDLVHQKEENVRRQELVRQSLDEKSQQLQREQEKLGKVNAELEAIEHELARDVETLREMIDQLSRNIVLWEEDHKLKKQAYLDSEKQLTTAKERRENLTKHLHQIIVSNESRKALKLEQLMSALDVKNEDTSTK